MSLTKLPAWQALVQRRAALSDFRLAQAFRADSRRSDRFRLEAAGLMVDYSRQLLDEAALDGLLALAEACEFAAWRTRLFSGAIVNDSEGRAALHPALRGASADAAIRAKFAAEQERFLQFAEQLRSGQARGSSGAAIDTVVCLGIGGSDLGPRLALDALRGTVAPSAVTLHLVANLDPLDLATALAQATPQRTLVVAISKSFGTLETLENLRAALDWLRRGGVADPSGHLAAVTARVDAARGAGVPAERIFAFDATIGGRYSLWSACGLPIAVGAGRQKFEALLAGAAAMDAHFIEAPPRANAPLLLGLLAVWQGNLWDAASRAVFPYASRLRLLPAYLQQLEMESLGKSVDRAGTRLAYATGNVVWGDVGSVAQHSVFQFLHQGTQVVPVEFIVDDSMRSGTRRERLLHANAVAQADALAFGDAALGAEASTPHARVAGNRPSTIIQLPRVDAGSLGALLALYEHRVFVQSVLWGINAFDQWGVELGKQLLARRIEQDSTLQESTT